MKRATITALVAVAAVAPAAAAEAAFHKQARFVGHVSAKQVTTWNVSSPFRRGLSLSFRLG